MSGVFGPQQRTLPPVRPGIPVAQVCGEKCVVGVTLRNVPPGQSFVDEALLYEEEVFIVCGCNFPKISAAMGSSKPDIQPRSSAYTRIGSVDSPRKFYNQDFESLRNGHLQGRTLFTDESFPANINSIGSRLEAEFNTQNITWRRPGDFCRNPHLIVDGTSLFDILQSQLGDCWVLCAIGSITLKPGLLRNIIPGNQDYGANYAGIFHFRLWHLGEWVDIVIDDLLPFLNGKYLSVRPSCGNEFWPCLLEKAYAKLLGSYQNLHWGDPAEAFVNLTGGLTMSFDLKNSQIPLKDLWNMVSSAGQDILMACVYNQQKLSENVFLNNGLVERHAYCITDVAKVQIRNGFVKLIRIWNPWGYGEWRGAWNDKSPWWQELREEERQKLQRVREDGEFWMSWEDFTQEFSRIILCSQVPDFLDWGQKRKRWCKRMFWNCWTKDTHSSEEEWLSRNPQYAITVNPSDEAQGSFNVVISLMQSSRNRQKFGGDWLPIGFVIFKVSDTREKLPASFFTPKDLSGLKACRQRDLTSEYQLEAGTYVIVPFTTDRRAEASFLLQIFLKSKDCASELGSAEKAKKKDPQVIENVSRQNAPKENVAHVNEKNSEKNAITDDDSQIYEKLFKQYASKGNLMYSWELQRCLNEVFAQGLGVGNDLLGHLIVRYGDSEEKLNFVDYLACMVRLKTTAKTFQLLSTDGGRGVYIEQEKLLSSTSKQCKSHVIAPPLPVSIPRAAPPPSSAKAM
ncbi:calpain-13-like [Gastrophryne carolinensis]